IQITSGDIVLVQGNRIGTDISGTANLGNGGAGVSVVGGDRSSIGGTAAGMGNTIAFNAGAGVAVTGLFSTGDRIQGNAICANGGLGIDLDTSGVTANDAKDLDGGPNNLQNFPTLTGVSSTFFSTTVGGTLSSTPSTTFRLEFFVSGAADPSGFGEGQSL